MAAEGCLRLCLLLVAVSVGADAHTPGAEDPEVVSINGQHDHHHIIPNGHPSKVSFSYDHKQKASDMGEPVPDLSAASNGGITAKMVQMGTLLDGVGEKVDESDAGEAVASLTSALQAKLLMNKLKPDGIGSYVAQQQQAHKQQGLGEQSDEEDKDDEDKDQQKFDRLMHAKKKNMAAITAYLMSRKAQGRPLTASEDQQLQKFYYNRASTILKRIVLLRKGETPPEFDDQSDHDDDHDSSTDADKQIPAPEEETQSEAADETEKLKYDAAVANDNTMYDNKEADKLERQEEAQDAERMAEDREEMDKLEFDRKIAKANEKYNDELLSQVRKEANKAKKVSLVAHRAAEALKQGLAKEGRMTKVEEELQKQKAQAQAAVLRFTSEQEEAEQKVEVAEKAKQEADKEAAKAAAMLAAAENAAVTNAKSKNKGKKIPIPHFSTAERMHNMVQYLQTALSHHNHLSAKDLKIMQTFFLEHGGHMLSKLAQIEPDATWNDKGVMRTEQWAMDHNRPDQLSEEWGGKRVKKDTIIRDVVKHELDKRESKEQLRRPSQQPGQAIQGLFGQASKLHLKFAPDNSKRIEEEPELGDSMEDEVEQLPNEYAYQSMMGIN